MRALSLSKRAAYEIARRQICETIVAQGMTIGEPLMSLTRWMEELGAGRRAVQRALEDLAKDGTIETIWGKGSFLARIPELERLGEGRDMIVYKKKKLKVGILADLVDYGEVWYRVLKEFAAEQRDVTVEVVEFQSVQDLKDIHKLLSVDLFQIPQCSLPSYIDRELLFPLHDIEPEARLSEGFLSGFRTESVADGYWGVPISASTNVLFYEKKNEELLANVLEQTSYWSSMEALRNLSQDLGARQPELHPKCLVAHHSFFHDEAIRAGVYPDRPLYDDFLQGFREPLESFLRAYELYYCDAKLFYRDLDYQSVEQYSGVDRLLTSGPLSWRNSLSGKDGQPLRITHKRVEPRGKAPAHSHLMVMSTATHYPEEGFELLQYLSRASVQETFAQSGMVVAHGQALEALKVPYLDESSHQAIRDAFSQALVFSSKQDSYMSMIHRVGTVEMKRWQNGELNISGLLDRLDRKFKYFVDAEFRAKRALQIHHGQL